jgi:hypothetical protein
VTTRVAEQQPSFDAAKYKNAQREQWNKDGAAWRRWNPILDRWYGEVTRQMLELARIQPGQRILDIAAGMNRRSTRQGSVIPRSSVFALERRASEPSWFRGLKSGAVRHLAGLRTCSP